LIDLLKGFDQFKSDRLIAIFKCNKEVELEACFVQVHLLGDFLAIGFKAVLDKQVCNEIKENQCTSSSTKGYMRAIGLNLQSLAHRSFDEVGIVSRNLFCRCNLLLFNSFFIKMR